MIRHIVMWKFREGTEEKANEFLTKLAALDGVIPQSKRARLRATIGKDNYDAVLVSEFETMDDLNAYKVDPRHGRRERYLQVHPRRPRGRRLRNVNSKRGSTAFAVLPLFACSGPQAAIAESGLDRRSAPLIVADLQLQHAGEIHIEVDRTNAA